MIYNGYDPNQLRAADGKWTDGPQSAMDKAKANVGGEKGNDSDKQDKEKQLQLINENNPAPNNYNTWIRKVEDIKTADEAFKTAFEDGEMYPDFTVKDMQKALSSNEVTIYSSYPIKNGNFVTPSKMNAEDYAGGKGKKIYSKVVKLNEIAWIDEGEGQFASLKDKK